MKDILIVSSQSRQSIMPVIAVQFCSVTEFVWTFAVNLAVALAKKCQLKVGLLDADVYGPSIPMMMKIDQKPEVTKGNALFLST